MGMFIVIALALWNLIVFFMYGIDKGKAKRNKRRISEKTLILSAAIFGAVGALIGMSVFRHKTNHKKFTLGVPLLLILNIAVIFLLVRYTPIFSAGASTAATYDAPQYQRITHTRAREMMDAYDVIVLDVRAESEFVEGHIQNAVLLPLPELEQFATDILPDFGQTILVYCRSGNRSAAAARQLAELGFTSVYDFGGIMGWPYEVVGS